MRQAHALKRSKGKKMGRNFIWVDTETRNENNVVDVGNHTLYFGVALHHLYSNSSSIKPQRTDKITFDKSINFWAWAISKIHAKETLWILAHNWNYDAGILSTQTNLEKMGFKLTLYINEKPPVIVRWKDDKGRSILMIDTLNYFRTSVADLGLSIGSPKLPMPSDYDSLEKWEEYAWQDVRIIRDAFLLFRRFIIEKNLGTLQPTLASQSFATYRYRFMPKNVEIMVHDRERFLRMEREAFHGGRTESFFRGTVEKPLYKFDINSQYPAIMYNHQLPYEPVKYYGRARNPLPIDLQHALDDGFALTARVRLITDVEAYPVKHDGKLIFPIGEFETTLTTPEIEYALKRNHIQKVYRYCTYKKAFLFREYVDYFFGERQRFKSENNNAFQYLCKIFMNSLYGKFGQNGRKWGAYSSLPKGTEYHQPEGSKEIIRIRNIMGQTQSLSKEPESENSVPNIAAEITARGRIQLWTLIEAAGMAYYADTDSLIVDSTGYNNLSNYLSDTKLGMLKLESVHNSASFIAPKHYILDGKLTLKGVKKNAIKTENGDFIQDRFSSWDSLTKQGIDGKIPITKVRKRISGINTKRVMMGENTWTKPIKIKAEDPAYQLTLDTLVERRQNLL